MTEEEKREADLQTTLRKAKSSAKKEWESSLPEPWKDPQNFKWPAGTLVSLSNMINRHDF